MIIFETERLVIKSLERSDKKFFTELYTDPKVLEQIPQKPLTESEITERFKKSLDLEISDLNRQKCACAIFEKGNPEMIGLSLFLINDENEKELGYRFRVPYWGKGYGTETTKGMLKYYFNMLHSEKVTADVHIENVASVKILEKFMEPKNEFFNEKDHCIDRRYELARKTWLQSGHHE